MANDANPVQIPAVSLVHGSQAPTRVTTPAASGKALPQAGNAAAEAASSSARSGGTTRTNDVQAQVAFLNKYLNDSGKPAQFRVAPNSNSQLIQEINPATGEVIGEFSSSIFPALARSLGISSALIDEHA